MWGALRGAAKGLPTNKSPSNGEEPWGIGDPVATRTL
jgi:hypothetical protein